MANNTFDILTPEMLEAVAGGMTEQCKKSVRNALRPLKAAGMDKATVLRIMDEQEYSPNDYERWETTKAEMLAFVDANWDSF